MVKTRTKGQKTDGRRRARRTKPRKAGATSRGKPGYEIRLRNHLQARWAEWFDGWTITNIENDEVILTSSCTDHAGLHGVLDKIRDLNLTLISVRQISADPSGSGPQLGPEESDTVRRTK